MDYEKEINKRLAVLHLTIADLTPEELSEARDICEAEANGDFVLDGIFNSEDLLLRSYQKKIDAYKKE